MKSYSEVINGRGSPNPTRSADLYVQNAIKNAILRDYEYIIRRTKGEGTGPRCLPPPPPRIRHCNAYQEEWSVYAERLEHYFTAKDVKDASKRRAILSLVPDPYFHSSGWHTSPALREKFSRSGDAIHPLL